MTPSTKETMPVKVAITGMAAFMAVTGFAGTATGGVKLHYDRAHKAAVKRCGDERAAGRNVYRQHSTLSNGERVGGREYRALTARLDGLCRPVPVSAPHGAPVAAAPAASSPSSSSGGGGLPECTWKPESGGDYNAHNPSSGADGRYQIIPGTWAAHCSDLGHDPAGQDECASRILRAQGSGAWVNC